MTVHPIHTFGTCEIKTGLGVFGQLGGLAAALGKRALIVMGNGGSLARAGVVDRALGMLTEVGVTSALFAEVEPEPSLETVVRGTAACRDGECDIVVALGGGSAIDVGKAIAGLVGTGISLDDAFRGGVAVEFTGGAAVTAGRGKGIVSCIAVPTTAGTGAEVTFNSVLTDKGTGEKLSIRGKALLPTIALVDAELTASMGQALTAQTGMDALTQAIESFVSRGSSPITDALALESASLITRSLIRAFRDGTDLAAREDMAYGSLMAGMALANARLGVVHGMAHSIGSRCGIAHGLVCAILLPNAIEYNQSVAPAKFARLKDVLGCADVADYIRGLNASMGIPARLGEVGLTRGHIETIVRESLPSGSLKANPRSVSADDIREMLEANLC